MKLMSKVNMQVKTPAGAMINVVPGDFFEAPGHNPYDHQLPGQSELANTAGDLIRVGRAIDVKDKSAVAALQKQLASVQPSASTIKEALKQFKSLLPAAKSAKSEIESAQKKLIDIKQKISTNKLALVETQDALKMSTGDGLDDLFIRDAGLKSASGALMRILSETERELKATKKAKEPIVRQAEIARAEVWRCEFEQIARSIKKDLDLLHAAFDQQSQLIYMGPASFLSCCRAADEVLKFEAADPSVVEKMTTSLFEGV